MKKESFVNKISIYIGVTLVLLIWLLTAYTVSSFLLLKESEESSVWSTIQIYMKQIDSKFIAMDQCVEGIAGNQDLIGQRFTLLSERQILLFVLRVRYVTEVRLTGIMRLWSFKRA